MRAAPRTRLLGVCLSVGVTFASAQEGTAARVQDLVLDRVVERSLATGESHSYRVAIAAGRYLHLSALQFQADVAFEVSAPSAAVRRVDARTEGLGVEHIVFGPGPAAEVRVRLTGMGAGLQGRYRLVARSLDAQRDAGRIAVLQALADALQPGRSSAVQDTGSARALALAREHRQDDLVADILLTHAAIRVHRDGTRLGVEAGLREARTIYGRQGPPELHVQSLYFEARLMQAAGQGAAAGDLHREAVAAARALGDQDLLAVALNNLALHHHYGGDLDQAEALYGEALAAAERTGALTHVARITGNLGGIAWERGDIDAAATAFESSRRAHQGLNLPDGVAAALGNLAMIDRLRGQPRTYMARQGEALAIYRRLGDREGEARALHALATAYFDLGELQRAATLFGDALRLRQALGDRPGEAATRRLLGLLHAAAGRTGAALAELDAALGLAREANLAREVLGSLVARADTLAAAGRITEALAAYRMAEQASPAAGSRQREMEARAGALRMQVASEPRAADPVALLRLRDEARGMGHVTVELSTLLALGERALALGEARTARAHAADAVALVEAQRTRIASPELRATYLSVARQAHLAELRALRASPAGPERDAALLLASERARARAQLDLLADLDAADLRWVDEGQRAAHAATLARLNALANLRLERGASAAQDSEYQRLRAALDALEAARGPAPVAATPSTVAELQAHLAPGSVAVEYLLDDPVSLALVVTHDAVRAVMLPGRARLEPLVETVLEAWNTGRPAPGAALDQLSAALLEPLAGVPAEARLLIIPDGVLHRLPFAALRRDGAWLVERHELVHLPSLATLAARRGPGAAGGARVTVVADPVFSADDPRLLGRGPGRAAPDAGWTRLTGTRAEAAHLRTLVPAALLTVHEGFAAQRERLTGDQLANSRIIHLATHGVSDPRVPHLSGLVLSRFAADGSPQPEFLDLNDVHGMRLGAELVVLSACASATGRLLPGEGALGLPVAFRAAGARGVVASLWRIPDRATADLMQDFYTALLRDKRSPAAALRAAQQAALRGRARDPRLWAAFTYQGH